MILPCLALGDNGASAIRFVIDANPVTKMTCFSAAFARRAGLLLTVCPFHLDLIVSSDQLALQSLDELQVVMKVQRR